MDLKKLFTVSWSDRGILTGNGEIAEVGSVGTADRVGMVWTGDERVEKLEFKDFLCSNSSVVHALPCHSAEIRTRTSSSQSSDERPPILHIQSIVAQFPEFKLAMHTIGSLGSGRILISSAEPKAQTRSRCLIYKSGSNTFAITQTDLCFLCNVSMYRSRH